MIFMPHRIASMSSSKPSINWKNCLHRCNNNKTLAHDLLNMLLKELPTSKTSILKSFNQQSLTQFKRHVHKLHGACACCGADALQNLLADIEQHLDLEQTLPQPAVLSTLIDEIDRTTNSIKNSTYLNAN